MNVATLLTMAAGRRVPYRTTRRSTGYGHTYYYGFAMATRAPRPSYPTAGTRLGIAIVGRAIVGIAIVGRAIVSRAIVSIAIVSRAIVSRAIVGIAIVSRAIVGIAIVSRAIVRYAGAS